MLGDQDAISSGTQSGTEKRKEQYKSFCTDLHWACQAAIGKSSNSNQVVRVGIEPLLHSQVEVGQQLLYGGHREGGEA